MEQLERGLKAAKEHLGAREKEIQGWLDRAREVRKQAQERMGKKRRVDGAEAERRRRGRGKGRLHARAASRTRTGTVQ
eukprot:7990335-Pyramimonas_sp.AAC.1